MTKHIICFRNRVDLLLLYYRRNFAVTNRDLNRLLPPSPKEESRSFRVQDDYKLPVIGEISSC